MKQNREQKHSSESKRQHTATKATARDPSHKFRSTKKSGLNTKANFLGPQRGPVLPSTRKKLCFACFACVCKRERQREREEDISIVALREERSIRKDPRGADVSRDGDCEIDYFGGSWVGWFDMAGKRKWSVFGYFLGSLQCLQEAYERR